MISFKLNFFSNVLSVNYHTQILKYLDVACKRSTR